MNLKEVGFLEKKNKEEGEKSIQKKEMLLEMRVQVYENIIIF